MSKKKIYMLIEDLFEDVEVIYPYYRLIEEGYEVEVVGPVKNKEYRGKKGLTMKSDIAASEIRLEDAAAVVIPGGYAPDRMVRYKEMVDIVKNAMNSCKIIAAICHGPLMLVEADVIKGKKVTGFKSIVTILKLAGGEFIDREAVTDGNIITSRSPDDLPAFCKSLVALLSVYYK
jgi:protease I